MPKELYPFRVTYLEVSGSKTRFSFDCLAEDEEHAKEQCENAYPGCETKKIARLSKDGLSLDDTDSLSKNGRLIAKMVVCFEKIDKAAHATAKKKDSKPSLLGVFIDPKGDAVASDGWRLVYIADAAQNVPDNGVILPNAFVSSLPKTGVGSIEIFERALVCGDVTGKPIKDKYPNWRLVIPKNSGKYVKFDSVLIFKAYREALAAKLKNPTVTFGKNLVTYGQGQSTSVGENTMMQTGARFNLGFLADIAKVAHKTDVFFTSNPEDPVFIIDGNGFHAVIMPLFLPTVLHLR